MTFWCGLVLCVYFKWCKVHQHFFMKPLPPSYHTDYFIRSPFQHFPYDYLYDISSFHSSPVTCGEDIRNSCSVHLHRGCSMQFFFLLSQVTDGKNTLPKPWSNTCCTYTSSVSLRETSLYSNGCFGNPVRPAGRTPQGYHKCRVHHRCLTLEWRKIIKFHAETQSTNTEGKKNSLNGVCVVLIKPYVAGTAINNVENTISKPVSGRPLLSFASSSSSSAFKFPHSWGSIRVWTTADSSCAADVIAVQTEGGCKTSDRKDEVLGQKSLPAQRSLECEKVLTAYLWSSTVEQKGSVMACKLFLSQNSFGAFRQGHTNASNRL